MRVFLCERVEYCECMSIFNSLYRHGIYEFKGQNFKLVLLDSSSTEGQLRECKGWMPSQHREHFGEL